MAGNRTRILVESGLTIALAYVLGRFVVYRMPMGGSVSLEMVPIMVFALRRGAGPGVVAGALYGLLELHDRPRPAGALDPVLHRLPARPRSRRSGRVGRVRLASRQRRSPALRGALTVVVPFTLLAAAARLAAPLPVRRWCSSARTRRRDSRSWLYSLVYNAVVHGAVARSCAPLATAAVLPGLERAVPTR